MSQQTPPGPGGGRRARTHRPARQGAAGGVLAGPAVRRGLLLGGALVAVVAVWALVSAASDDASPAPTVGPGRTVAVTATAVTTGTATGPAGAPGTPSPHPTTASTATVGASPGPTATADGVPLPVGGVCQLVGAARIGSLTGADLQTGDLPVGLDRCALVDDDAGWSVTYTIRYVFDYEGSAAAFVAQERDAVDPSVTVADLGLGDAGSYRSDQQFSGLGEVTTTAASVGRFTVDVRVRGPAGADTGSVAMAVTRVLVGAVDQSSASGWVPPEDWVQQAGG